MKKLLVTALLTATVAGGTAQVKNQSHGYPIDPVPFTSVNRFILGATAECQP